MTATGAPSATERRGPARLLAAGFAFGAATFAVALLGSTATSAGQDWYDRLDKPAFTPPDATFGIVWTVLYAAIALSGWLAWRAGPTVAGSADGPAAAADPPDQSVATPTIAWACQMVLNLLWTVVFFGLRAPWAGVFVIVALLAAIVVTIELDRRVSTWAAALLVPYLAWVGFASALTVGVAVMN
jgi:tryptophan-rich sensory protein